MGAAILGSMIVYFVKLIITFIFGIVISAILVYMIILFIVYSVRKYIKDKKVKNIMKNWDITCENVLTRFHELKKINILNSDESEIYLLNNHSVNNYQINRLNNFSFNDDKVNRLNVLNLSQAFMCIKLMCGEYKEDWEILAIKINKQNLFIKVKLEDERQQLFNFTKISDSFEIILEYKKENFKNLI